MEKTQDLWPQIDNAMSKNAELQKFRRVVAQNQNLLDMRLNHPDRLRKCLWRSYFKQIDPDVQALLEAYKHGRREIRKIVNQAKKERARWDKIVQEFNGRFYVPFEVKVVDREKVILEGSKPTLKFDYRDGVDKKSVGRGDLDMVMSSGEARVIGDVMR